MTIQIILFLVVLAVVGWVNILCAGPLEKGPMKEFLHYMLMVGGGIATFTGALVLAAILFQ